MTVLPTVKIKADVPRGWMIINAADFDPDVHERFEEAAKEPAAGSGQAQTPKGTETPADAATGTAAPSDASSSTQTGTSDGAAANTAPVDREALEAEANMLGVAFRSTIGNEGLQDRVTKAKEKLDHALTEAGVEGVESLTLEQKIEASDNL